MRPMLLKLTCLAALVLGLGASAYGTSPDLQAEHTAAAYGAASLTLTADQEYGLPDLAPSQEYGEEATEPEEEEEADPTLAELLAGMDIELSADETAAVAAYDAAADKEAFEWPTRMDDEEEISLSDDIIGYIQGYNNSSGYTSNNLWLMIAAMLVFVMHLGFATLETGLTQAKNTVNILFKNTFIIGIGILTYAICGFNLMYPGGDFAGGYFGFAGPGVGTGNMGDPLTFIANATETGYGYPYTYWTDFFFQAMFAATAATIISGCVAERIKLLPFLIFATIYVAILYPWLGMWHWGGGWIAEMGFVDYAGSTLVHSVGGWGGLAAILVLGARKGKYVDGKVRPILPSNLPLATIGVFLLWFGWFGFNGGSALSAEGSEVSLVLVQTSIAAALGGLTAGIVSWVVGGKPDLTMALNGILAGLVGITAAPDTSMFLTVFTGITSGAIVYFAVLGFDAIKIDDPVGALSVHLVCGIWGTFLAAFNGGSVATQITGIIAYGLVSFIFALVLALIVKAIFGFRVSEEEEVEGLDAGEHGMKAYHGLSIQ